MTYVVLSDVPECSGLRYGLMFWHSEGFSHLMVLVKVFLLFGNVLVMLVVEWCEGQGILGRYSGFGTRQC